MENFNPDPKPGRLILPLVLIGMIATTYTFINRVRKFGYDPAIAGSVVITTVTDILGFVSFLGIVSFIAL